jgi:hypothetical protein
MFSLVTACSLKVKACNVEIRINFSPQNARHAISNTLDIKIFWGGGGGEEKKKKKKVKKIQNLDTIHINLQSATKGIDVLNIKTANRYKS